MAATARQIPVSTEDLESKGSGGGGAYASIEVPGDYEAVLAKVEDYDKRGEGKSWGWVFYYSVETPDGKNVEFKTYISFGQNARWKLIEVMEAHDADLSEGLNEIDPNAFVGDTIGAHIDFPRDPDTDEPTSKYREIRSHFSLAKPPTSDDVGDSAGPPAAIETIQAADEEEVVKFGEEPDII